MAGVWRGRFPTKLEPTQHAKAGDDTNAHTHAKAGGRDARAEQWRRVGGATRAKQRRRRRAKRAGG